MWRRSYQVALRARRERGNRCGDQIDQMAKEIGRITSITYSPHLGRTIALGYFEV